MTPLEIEWLRMQDPTLMNGQLQVVLANKQLPQQPFSNVLQHLLTIAYAEKTMLVEENKKLTAALKNNGLYNSKELFGG